MKLPLRFFFTILAIANPAIANTNGDCEICSKENKVKLSSLTLAYFGGQGSISQYQDSGKASCRNQDFPESTTITVLGVEHAVSTGTIFTINSNDNDSDDNDSDDEGDEFESVTVFSFPSGSSVGSCFIHTSCSVPIVPGDQIGPFMVLQDENQCFAQGQSVGSGEKDGSKSKKTKKSEDSSDDDDVAAPLDDDSSDDDNDQDSTDDSPNYLPGECEICSKENKIRPISLTLEYIGGQGAISNYQTADKASCRDQIFPSETTVTAYDTQYDVTTGTVFTIFGEDGDEMDAETDFFFSSGDVNSCSIHTSCSQPLVAGDRLGPFVVLEGNDCTYCVCEVRPSYDNGIVTLDFDFCGAEPEPFDWIGIYPCDANTLVADEDWADSVFYSGDVFDIGYIEGEEYVNEPAIWFAYTCGSPGDKCQQNREIEWPTENTVAIDPFTNPDEIKWALKSTTTLAPGCYKAHMNRETIISGPPYPTICKEWAEANEFIVPP